MTPVNWEEKNKTLVWKLHLIINYDVSNKHICTNHTWKMWPLSCFQIATRITTSKNLKFSSIYFQMRNEAI